MLRVEHESETPHCGKSGTHSETKPLSQFIESAPFIGVVWRSNKMAALMVRSSLVYDSVTHLFTI
jgi:hypothetical protein